MGVPKSLDPWVDTLYEIIVNAIKKEIHNGWEYGGELEYTNPKTGEIEMVNVTKTDDIELNSNYIMNETLKLNNFSDVKEFLNSDMFMELPLWKPKIILEIKGFDKEFFDREFKGNTVNAGVLTELDHKLVYMGPRKVFAGAIFNFNPIIPIQGLDIRNEVDLKSSLSHELLHIYQKFKQLEGGKPSHYGKETSLNTLANLPLLTEIDIPEWKEFLHLVYLHLSFETNARVVELYYELKQKGVNNKESFLSELKKSSVWEQLIMLKSFKAEDFIKNFNIPGIDLPIKNDSPLLVISKVLNDKRLGDMYMRGLDVSSKESLIKSLIKLWDNILKIGNETIKDNLGIDFNMMPVPENAKKDPYVFFKFFENRFHAKAKKMERKLYKISSLLIN